jgi:hypothetical protein
MTLCALLLPKILSSNEAFSAITGYTYEQKS